MFKSTHAMIATVLLLSVVACSKPLSESEFSENVNEVIQTGNLNKAEILIKNFLADSPDAKQARMALGSVYTLRGNYLEAAHQFKRADYLISAPDQVSHVLESFYFTQNFEGAVDFYKALKDVDKAELNHDNFFMALLLTRQFQDPSKLNSLAASTAQNGEQQNVLALSKNSLDFYHDKDIVKFADKLKQSSTTESFKDDWFMVSLMASTHYFIGDYEVAAESYKHFTEIRPQYFETRLFLADSLVKSKKLAESERYAKDILRTFPEQPLANQILGMVELDRDNLEQAKIHFEKALASGYTSSLNYLLAGAINFQLNKYEQAIFQLERGLANASEAGDYIDMLRVAKSKTGNADAIIAELSEQEITNLSDIARVKQLVEGFKSVGNTAGIEQLFKAITFSNNIDMSTQLELDILQAQAMPSSQKASIENIEKLLASKNFGSKVGLAQNTKAKMLLIDSLYQAQDYQKAIQTAQQWVRESPESEADKLLLADALQMGGQNQQALDVLMPLVIDSQNAYVHRSMTKSLVGLNRLEDALNSAKAALSLSKYDLDLLRQYAYIEGQLAADTIDHAWMVSLYEYATEQESQAILLSMYFSMHEQFEQAIATLLAYKQAQHASLVYHYTLAETYLQLNDKEKALEAISHVSRESYIPFDGLMQVAETLLKLGERTEAKNMLTTQMRNYPQASSIVMLLAVIVAEDGDTKGALAVLNKTKLNSPAIMEMKSDLLLQTGDVAQGMQLLQSAYTSTTDKRLGLKLANTHLALGSKDQALALASAMQAQFPQDIDVQITLASASAPSDAEVLLRKIIEQDPTHDLALNNLAWSLFKQGKYQQALPFAQQAVAIASDNPNYQDTLSKIQQNTGS